MQLMVEHTTRSQMIWPSTYLFFSSVFLPVLLQLISTLFHIHSFSYYFCWSRILKDSAYVWGFLELYRWVVSLELNKNDLGINTCHHPVTYFMIHPVVSCSLLKINLSSPLLPLPFHQIRPLFLWVCNCKMSSKVVFYTCFLQSSKFEHRTHIMEAP